MSDLLEGDLNKLYKPAEPLHDELAEEIISEKPSSIERSFLWIILGSLLVLLILSWLIEYSDVIETSCILISKETLNKVVAKRDGYVNKIYVKEGDSIRMGQHIFEMKTEAAADEVDQLDKELDLFLRQITRKDKYALQIKPNAFYTHLGELQLPYLEFISDLKTIPTGNIMRLSSPSASEMKLIKMVYVIRNNIKQWKAENEINAINDGIFHFETLVEDGQFIPSNKLVGIIEPLAKDISIKVIIPQSVAISNVKIGMPVNISLDGYPQQEYGLIKGYVEYLHLDGDSIMCANVKLDNSLITDLHIPIPFRYGLKGKAFILSHKERLINRIKNNFKL